MNKPKKPRPNFTPKPQFPNRCRNQHPCTTFAVDPAKPGSDRTIEGTLTFTRSGKVVFQPKVKLND